MAIERDRIEGKLSFKLWKGTWERRRNRCFCRRNWTWINYPILSMKGALLQLRRALLETRD